MLRNRVSACGACKLVVLNSRKAKMLAKSAAGVEHVVAVAQNQNHGRISDRAGIEFCRVLPMTRLIWTRYDAFDIVGRGANTQGSDGRFILLEEQPHDEPIFSEDPRVVHETSGRRRPRERAADALRGRDSERRVCVESILNHRLTTIGGTARKSAWRQKRGSRFIELRRPSG